MGCICSRQAYVLDYGSPKGGGAEGKGSNRPSARWLVSSHRKEESAAAEITKTAVQSEPRNNKISVSNGLKNEKRRSSPGAGRSLEEEEEEKNRKGRRRRTKGEEEEEKGRNGGVDRQLSFEVSNIPGGIPRHVEAEQVAAGWPAWLTAVAGEAIRGWIPRKAESFEKLYKIGQGTYSNVYKARDLDNGKIVALKKVRFDNLEPESVRFMAREIQVLRRLDHPNIVKLEGLVTSGLSCSLYLVFEYMEHDLAGLAACPGIKFSEPQVKCYMQQLLCGLDHCHSRGVLHRDIKGSNLLIDNGGNLKIADFGLATFFRPGQKQVLTSRVVTLWYRPPELLLGATDYGVSVDLWSTGCILAELLTGKPIMPGRTEVEQLHKIFKLCGSPSEEYWKKSKLPHATIFKPQHPYKCCIAETFKDFPPTALALLQTLLAIEPADRGEATGALKSEFFTTKPLPCDPSTLPKYPPSKEFDAKLRAEEARRQRAAGGRALVPEVARRASRQARGGPAPDATAESLAPTQKQHMSVYGASNNRNGKSTPKQHESHIDPPRPVHHPYESTAGASRVVHGTAFSGPLLYGDGTGSTFGKKHKEDGIDRLPGRSPFQSSKASIGSDLKTHGKQPAGDLSKTARSGGGRKYDVTETYKYQGSLLQQNLADALVGIQNGKHEESKVSEPSAKQNRAHLQKPESLDRLDSDLSGGYAQRDERHASREPFKGRGTREQRILYSGPLLPPSANIDEILQKHEQNIQRAVRRARHSKGEAVRNASEHKSSVPSPKGKQGSSNLKGEREHLSSLMENRGRKQEI